MMTEHDIAMEKIEAGKRKKDKATIGMCGLALSAAIPYVAPLAEKNSAKGDEAMAVLSQMMAAMAMVRESLGLPPMFSENDDGKAA
jgi:hypothetical protein